MEIQPNKASPEKGQRSVSIIMLIPNLVTLVGLSFGLTAIRLVIEGHFATAVFFLLIAVIIDGLDGLLARRLGATSLLGAQLDSLSDFLCFGIAPAILMYELHIREAGGLGWIAALLFAVAMALRLARFNVMSKSGSSEKQDKHFTGVPAPAGALLGLLPAFLTFADIWPAGAAPALGALWMCVVALLMISTLKTISLKSLKFPRRFMPVILAVAIVFLGLCFARPWLFMIAVDTAYFCAILWALFTSKGRIFT